MTDLSTLTEFLAALDSTESDAVAQLSAADSPEALEEARIATLGDTRGALRPFQAALRELTGGDKPAAGRRFNAVRQRLESLLEERTAAIARGSSSEATADPTMPPRTRWRGIKHPVSAVIEEIVDIFREFGFTVAQGPDAESMWYNFTALNFPDDHSALDAHDTLFLEDGGLLRTHTSPVQMRTLQRFDPPVRVLIPGMVYRRDFFDPSHAPAFAQIEGLAVDEGISFVDLKAMLNHFAKKLLGSARTRFRPSYFPFTEPSAEMDVQCGVCGGSGCGVCKGTGWIEILGSGMVHPKVLENAGIDSERYTGWAFGMGPARIALSRYQIPDIRLLYDADVRFLEQFAE